MGKRHRRSAAAWHAAWLLALALAQAAAAPPPASCPTGAFQTEADALDMPAVRQHADGRVYFAGEPAAGDLPIDPAPGDELLGATAADGFVLISSLSFDQLVRMPSGTFLLPVVAPLDSGGGRLTKFLHVTVVQPEALTWRPSKASRRAAVSKFKAEHPSKVFHWPAPSSTGPAPGASKPPPPSPLLPRVHPSRQRLACPQAPAGHPPARLPCLAR